MRVRVIIEIGQHTIACVMPIVTTQNKNRTQIEQVFLVLAHPIAEFMDIFYLHENKKKEKYKMRVITMLSKYCL